MTTTLIRDNDKQPVLPDGCDPSGASNIRCSIVCRGRNCNEDQVHRDDDDDSRGRNKVTSQSLIHSDTCSVRQSSHLLLHNNSNNQSSKQDSDRKPSNAAVRRCKRMAQNDISISAAIQFVTRKLNSCSVSQASPLTHSYSNIVIMTIIILLLPSLRYERGSMSTSSTTTTTTHIDNNLSDLRQQQNQHQCLINILIALARFPFDRLRLTSGLSLAAAATHTYGSPAATASTAPTSAVVPPPPSQQQQQLQQTATSMLMASSRPHSILSNTVTLPTQADLQEEETQMMLLTPAEHRSGSAGAHTTPVGMLHNIAPLQHHHHHQQQQHHHPHNQGHYIATLASAVAADPMASSSSSASHLSSNNDQQQQGPQHEYVPAMGNGNESPQQSGAPAMDSPNAAASDASNGGAVAIDSPGGQQSSTSLQMRNDLPSVRALNVKCEKNHMTVNIVFDRPFYGMVFSKGHYNDQKCIHLPPNSGQTSVNFDIHLGKCGMTSSDATGLQIINQQQQQQQQQPNGLYIENTIIIQYDPLVQEIYDQARKLRCTWYDYYEKSVTFRPYNVDMLDAVTANFLGDNIQCWMQIQVGKGPWSSEVAGIVKIGQTMTMVLAIKDDENRFDMLVRNCVAHDGKHQPIQLVDEYGCVARPKIMAKFQKVRNFGPAATVVSYAHFQAFKFPDSMSVHFQCVIQVCRYECPEPVCPGANGALGVNTNGGSNDANGGADYATSGTEMIAAKELPAGVTNQQVYQQMAPPYSGHSQSSQHSMLKLDESQGRVQVKLDTSMMAGGRLGNSTALPSSPAHTTLHASGLTDNQKLASGLRTAYSGSSGYYKQSSASQLAPSSSSSKLANQPAQSMLMSASTSTGQQQQQQGQQYSPQYPQFRRTVVPAYATHHRVGDLSKMDTDATKELISESNNIEATIADTEGRLLSLMAAPRGFARSGGAQIVGQQGAFNHRYRRALDEYDLANTTGKQQPNSVRNGRHVGPQESTSVQTQKTIQVVSSDDVAFSLQSDEDAEPVTNDFFEGNESKKAPSSGRSVSRTKQSMQYSSSVCFSTARFLLGLMVTLIALISGIVAVTIVILRQRSRIEQKLSTVYDDCSANANLTSTMHASPVYNEPIRNHLHFQRSTDECLNRQQIHELDQRWSRLSRLCSQFTPSLYWR